MSRDDQQSRPGAHSKLLQAPCAMEYTASLRCAGHGPLSNVRISYWLPVTLASDHVLIQIPPPHPNPRPGILPLYSAFRQADVILKFGRSHSCNMTSIR